jgi:predicted translation initiation factor SUI1
MDRQTPTYFLTVTQWTENFVKRRDKNILFLCTGNYFRSRYAEVYFNAVAAQMGLTWHATSRGLAIERGAGNPGPISPYIVKAIKALPGHDGEALVRMPVQATSADFAQAEYIVALKKAEHEPLMQERFPGWIEKIEYWEVDDAPDVLALIETEIVDLTARLIVGGKRQEREEAPLIVAAAPAKGAPAVVVKVGRETKGRRGKGVTVVWDLPLDEAGLEDLAATLKQKCGTGGAVKNGRIEIQGDQRERLAAVLESLGYRVKHSGG